MLNTLYFQNNSINDMISAFDYIEATIHHFNPIAHNSFCQKDDAYEFVIKNLKQFESKQTHLGIVFNITSNTYNYIYKTVQQIIDTEKISIDHIVLQRIIPIGRAFQKKDW